MRLTHGKSSAQILARSFSVGEAWPASISYVGFFTYTQTAILPTPISAAETEICINPEPATTTMSPQTISAPASLYHRESQSDIAVATRRCNIVVCVVSSHGLVSLLQILPAIRPSFPVPIVLVPDRFTILPDSLRFVLEEHSLLQIRAPVDDETPLPGSLYLAHGNLAVTIRPNRRFSVPPFLSIGSFQPIDRLLHSASRAYDGRVAALMLTNSVLMGTEGIRHLRKNGGLVLSSDDFKSEQSSMESGLDSCVVNYWLPPDTVAPVLESLASERIARI